MRSLPASSRGSSAGKYTIPTAGRDAGSMGSELPDTEFLVHLEAPLQVVADVPARAAGHATEAAEDVLLHALEAVEIEVGAGGKRDPHHVGPVEPLRLELEGG